MFIVTGGSGLIGSAVLWKLNQAGIDDVLVVDHLGTSDKWKNLAPLKFSDYLEKGEFREKMLAGAFDGAKIEGFLHLGACSSTTERDASYLVDNNFKYTCEVAEFCVKNRVRLVYASSCATYGDGSQGYDDDDDDTIEKLRPMNMYGYSKQMFDLWAKRRGFLKMIAGCKFSNVYGPNERHKGEMRSVVLRSFEQITANGTMKLFKSYRQEYADGEQLRDFLYVKDAVEMVMFLFDTPKANGLFNIGSGKPESWNKLARAAFAALDKPEKIEYIEMPETLRDRYQYYTCAKTDKLRRFGYDKPVTSLEESVKDCIRNYFAPDKHLGDE